MAGGGASPALIRGVLLDLSLLLRVSHGGLPAFRPSAAAGAAAAVDAAASTAGAQQRRALSEEEQLERRIRMEIVGGGAAAASSASAASPATDGDSRGDDTSFVGGLAQALGVRGFDRQQGRPLLDPRDPLGSAMASRDGHAPGLPLSPPSPVTTPSPPPPPLTRGGGKEDVRAKYMEKLKARTVGKATAGAGGVEDEAARRTRVRRLVEATELRGGGDASTPSAAAAAPPGSALLSSPVLELLGYLGWRGLRLGLLPRGRTITPAELVGARPPHASVGFDALLPLALDAEAAERERKLSLFDDDRDEEREKERQRRLEEGLKWLSGQLRVEPRRLLVVTGEAPLARAGRAGGFFTCLVQGEEKEGEGGEGGRGAGVDYRVGAWEEVRDVVEDLNGVSLRPWPPR